MSTTSDSRLVIVVGSGRSGTSTVAGTLKYLGLRVPPPEIAPNETNPRGFFEPRWVVDFHKRELPLGPHLLHKIDRDDFVALAKRARLRVIGEPAFLPYQYFLVMRPTGR